VTESGFDQRLPGHLRSNTPRSITSAGSPVDPGLEMRSNEGGDGDRAWLRGFRNARDENFVFSVAWFPCTSSAAIAMSKKADTRF
jgi:hypothetical protein